MRYEIVEKMGQHEINIIPPIHDAWHSKARLVGWMNDLGMRGN